MNKRGIGFNTIAVKAYLDGKRENRPLSVPLYQSTNFQAESSEQLGFLFRSKTDHMYIRFGHPTLTALAGRVAELEGAGAALAFSSGMGAITTALIATLRPGDHVVAQREIFAQTFTFLDRVARGLGIQTDFVDAGNLEQVRAALRNSTKLVYVETPSNPLIKVSDIQEIVNICRPKGIAVFVDSTFASPVVQKPLNLGATLVLHSGTKFINGHSDVMCGVAAGDPNLIGQIKEMQILLGNILDPHAAWLALRGMKTLGLRVERQSQNALAIAEFLESQRDVVSAVHYPWLESSPFASVARKQMRMGGGMLSFEVLGGLQGARTFLDSLRLIPIASSLGGLETIVEIPWDLDFSSEELGAAASETGITPGLIRLSAGIEETEDLIEDLKRGAQAVKEKLSLLDVTAPR